MDDAKIVQLYMQKDELAIAETNKKYGPRLRSLAQSILGDPAAAEECENDAYMQAWKLIPPHDPGEYLFSFLAKIIRNLAIDRIRHRDRQKRSAVWVELTAEMEQVIASPDDTSAKIDDIVFGEILNSFLRTLPTEKRSVFLRRYWYADSIADIAKRFGMSQSKVKSMLARIRGELRKYLEKEGISL